MCLQALLEAFDASHVTSGMLWSLISGWCGDVAAALASHAADVEGSVQLAANAAAGKWRAVVRHSCTRCRWEHACLACLHAAASVCMRPCAACMEPAAAADWTAAVH